MDRWNYAACAARQHQYGFCRELLNSAVLRSVGNNTRYERCRRPKEDPIEPVVLSDVDGHGEEEHGGHGVEKQRGPWQ